MLFKPQFTLLTVAQLYLVKFANIKLIRSRNAKPILL